MKKLQKIITTLSSIGLTAAITPIVAASCSSSKGTNTENKPDQPNIVFPDYVIDSETEVDSIPGPVQPEQDTDTETGIGSIPGPAQSKVDIKTIKWVKRKFFDTNIKLNIESIVFAENNKIFSANPGLKNSVTITATVAPAGSTTIGVEITAKGDWEGTVSWSAEYVDPNPAPELPDDDVDTDLGAGSTPGPIQPEEDIDTDMNVDATINQVISIEYNELIALKRANNLLPGHLYRITDYVASTSKTDISTAANNRFDIIVEALSENVLSENAKAIQSKADTKGYFANSNLAAWTIKYSLENNQSRFNWASNNGKGVVYYMKDEFGNEASYDFKNMKFKPYYDATKSKTNYNKDIFCYTFASDYTANNTDLSIDANNKVYWNSITPNTTNSLPRIVLFGTENYNNKFADGCKNITFGSSLTTNSDGTTYYKGNNFGNTFAQFNEKMTFEGSCHSNSFGQKNYDNYFGVSIYYNTFGIYNSSNVFGNNFVANSFGNDNYRNKFGNYNWSNSFGNDNRDNTFGNDCYYNDFGNNCYNNKLGNNCRGNLFAINCVGVTLKDGTSNQKINL